MRVVRGGIALKGLTPVLDMVFLLLFALLAISESRETTRQDRVHVRLPQVETGSEAPQEARQNVLLEIDADSEIRVGGRDERLTSREALDQALSKSLGTAVAEEVNVEIHADQGASTGVAVALLQHLRLRGFLRVSLVATGSSGATDLFGEGK